MAQDISKAGTTQTAVEWFRNELHKWLNDKSEQNAFQIFQQAKAMEKEQIAKAFNEGMLNSVDYFGSGVEESEKYYNETYNK
jgi:hypothetical protein